MPGQSILLKSNLSYWLRQLRKEMELIAPVSRRGEIVFESIDRIHEIALDCPALIPSPKEFLFPQLEPMLRSAGNRLLDMRDNSRRVIFGVRSCDVSALGLLDRFFLDDPADPYYEARRRNTLVISVACNRPDSTCFCASLGTGPYLQAGFDIQLYDLGDRYLVEAGSGAAASWIRRFSFLMGRPSKSDLVDLYEVKLSSQSMFHRRVSLKGAQRMMQGGEVSEAFWEKVTGRCIECGGCVYCCPVCTCFSVMDNRDGKAACRTRLWDTCMFKGFTRMAGGVLPAADRRLRTKRWFEHKVLYYPETAGAFGCVGCGRCAVTCPGRIDMASVVSRIEKHEK